MKTTQLGFGKDFGLVGNNVRRYLQTTALTATGLMAIAAPAAADNWTDHVADVGSISIDTGTPSTTNITQNTDFVKVHGDGDINAGWTVNVAQPSSSSKYVLYDIENDPTFIRGNLNANGQIYIFDQNGVIFSDTAAVNVGSIITSTGYISDANIKAGKLAFENVGGAGEIVNNGAISVADAGLAAFVAPTVKNSGVIKAKMGKVVLASGNKVTLDLYGDDLVSIAADDALANALVENAGTIKAEGGTVVLSAQAAKNAVDNVINMDGVVDVSSVSMKGGKIVLSGGNKGTVTVSGKVDASGAQGGSVSVKGENVLVADSSETLANGAGATVDFIAGDHADFRGTVLATDGAVEVSGYGSLGFSGLVNAKTLLLDPQWAVIHSGVLNNPLGLGYVLSAQALANSMQSGTQVTVQADDFIDVGTRNDAYNTGNAVVDGILNTIIGTGNIDLSTYDYYAWVSTGPFPWQGYVGHFTGTTQAGIKFDSDTVNFNKNLKMGDGNVEIDAATVNLDSLLKDKNGNLLGDARILSNANTVNVISPDAKIQQGIWVSNDAGGATVNVAAGTYNESVQVNRAITLKGANAGTAGYGARGPETIVDPNSPGFHVTANGVLIDGFTITSTSGSDGEGVWVDGASNVAVINNIINNTSQNGIRYSNAGGTNNIFGNKIDDTGHNGILVNGGGYFSITNNHIGTDSTSGIYGNGIKADHVYGSGLIAANTIQNTIQDEPTGDDASGVYLANSSHFDVDGNTISNTQWDGVKVFGGVDNDVTRNIIDNVARVGIWGYLTNSLSVLDNMVSNTNVTAGIGIEGGKDVLIEGNTVKETHENGDRADGISVNGTKGSITITKNTVGALDGSTDIEGNGIALYYTKNALVQGNFIYHTKTVNPDRASGVYVNNGYSNLIDNNTIRNADWDGIKIFGGNGNTVQNNDIAHSTRVGIWGYLTNALQVLNNLVVDSNVTAGIGIEGGNDVNVEGNTVKETHDHGYLADGISIRKTDGTITVTGNTVGDSEKAKDIEGNGIALYEVDDAVVQGNSIYNTKTTVWDGTHASGIYVFKGNRNLIGGLGEDEGNYIRNANWDGIKIHAGNENTVIGNDIAHSTRVGIYGVATNNLHILNNLVRDSNVTAGIGVEYTNSANIENNDVGDSVEDGILANVVNGNIRITGNTVDQSTDDGIDVKNSQAYVYIAGNTVNNSGFSGGDEFGGDGISVRNVSPNYMVAPNVLEGDAGNGEYNVVVYDNGVTNSADDGIEISGADVYPVFAETKVAYYDEGPYKYYPLMGRVLVMDNSVQNSGSGFGGQGPDGNGNDGIHVSNVYPEGFASAGISEGGFYGYSVDVIGNNVENSNDDGIEVTNTFSTYIASNRVQNSGFIFDSEEDLANYDTGDYPWGADGIHVRNVWSNNEYYDSVGLAKISEGEEYYEYYRPYSVVIDGNTVDNSVDDGIQVLFSGDTLVQNNGVSSSGFGPDERLFGGDGINIVNGINPYDEYYYYSPEYWSWMDIRPTSAEVYNNNVTDSADDGIEVVGATDVWIDGNDVSNSGDDGINVLGFAGFYGDEESPEEEVFAKASLIYLNWPYFYANISDNTVDTSGGDGIEVRGFDEAHIYANDVSNSTANGLFVSGFNNGYVDVFGNTFDGFDIGGNFESGLIDLTGESNTFRNGRVGLRFAPYSFGGGEGEGEIIAFSVPSSIYEWLFPYPFSLPSSGFAPLALVDDDAPGVDPYVPGVVPTNFGGTIGAQIFENISQYYVELDNEAFFAPGFPTWLNGLNSSYDGLVPADDADGILDQATYDALEAKFFHYIDRQDLGLFFFGLREEDAPSINQNLIFNRFASFNGDITGLNVTILGLPNIPGGGNPVNFNNITPAAGGNGGNNPSNLNNITPAAGGNEPGDLNNIETQAGGQNDACWSSAMNTAGTGQVVNVVYNGSFADNLNQAAACGGTF